MSSQRSRRLLCAAAAVYLFLYAPLVVVVAYSFNQSRLGAEWTGFTLHWYQVLFADAEMMRAAWNSLVIGLVASVSATVFGTLAGLALHKFRLRLLPVLIVTPLAIPDILWGVSLLVFFVLLNLTLGMLSVILAHVAFCISYVAVVIRARLSGMDESLVEAARDLGATAWGSFRFVTLPLMAPGIIAGALLAFTMSIDDFVITFFTAGVGTTTLPLKIYTMIKVTVTPEINAVSTLLMALTMLLVLAIARLSPQIPSGKP